MLRRQATERDLDVERQGAAGVWKGRIMRRERETKQRKPKKSGAIFRDKTADPAYGREIPRWYHSRPFLMPFSSIKRVDAV